MHSGNSQDSPVQDPDAAKINLDEKSSSALLPLLDVVSSMNSTGENLTLVPQQREVSFKRTSSSTKFTFAVETPHGGAVQTLVSRKHDGSRVSIQFTHTPPRDSHVPLPLVMGAPNLSIPKTTPEEKTIQEETTFSGSMEKPATPKNNSAEKDSVPLKPQVELTTTIVQLPPDEIKTPPPIKLSSQPGWKMNVFSFISSVSTALYAMTGIVGLKTSDIANEWWLSIVGEIPTPMPYVGFIALSFWAGISSQIVNTILNRDFISKGFAELKKDFTYANCNFEIVESLPPDSSLCIPNTYYLIKKDLEKSKLFYVNENQKSIEVQSSEFPLLDQELNKPYQVLISDKAKHHAEVTAFHRNKPENQSSRGMKVFKGIVLLVALCAAFSSGILAFSGFAWSQALLPGYWEALYWTLSTISSLSSGLAFLGLRYRGIKNLIKKVGDWVDPERKQQNEYIDQLYEAHRKTDSRNALNTKLAKTLNRRPLSEDTVSEFLEKVNPTKFPNSDTFNFWNILGIMTDIVISLCALGVGPTFAEKFLDGFKKLSHTPKFADFSTVGKIFSGIGATFAGLASTVLYASAGWNFRSHLWNVGYYIRYQSKNRCLDASKTAGTILLVNAPAAFSMYGAGKDVIEGSDFFLPGFKKGSFQNWVYEWGSYFGGFVTNCSSLLSAVMPLSPNIGSIKEQIDSKITDTKITSNGMGYTSLPATPKINTKETSTTQTPQPELYDVIRYLELNSLSKVSLDQISSNRNGFFVTPNNASIPFDQRKGQQDHEYQKFDDDGGHIPLASMA